MKKHSTFLLYFLSYFIIVCLLLTTFTIITRKQLTKIYTDQLTINVDKRLYVVQEQINDNINSIYNTHLILKSDNTLINYRYNSNPSNQQKSRQILSNYQHITGFLDGIIYIDKNNMSTMSTKYHVQYLNETCYIYDTSGGCVTLSPDELALQKKNTLFYLSDSDKTYLIYFPKDANASYFFIYLINLQELQQIFKDNMVDGITAFALKNNDTSQLYGINTTEILSSCTSIPNETGIYDCNNSNSIYVHSNIYTDFSLVALFSSNYFITQVQETLRYTYLLLFVIGIVGFFLILFSMKFTYVPLAKLAKRVLPHTDNSCGYIEQLDNAFSTAITEKELLQEKINKYHLSIQQSLLNSGVCSIRDHNWGNLKNFEQIFRTDCDNCIYMLRFHFTEQQLMDKKIQAYLEATLPQDSATILLESGVDYCVYITNYIGSETNKDDVIHSLMTDLYHDWNCFCAISNSVSSLTDIPTLYEKTLIASKSWPDIPVVKYTDIALEADINDSIYPYKLLEMLTENLKKLDFTEALKYLRQLLAQLDQLLAPGSNYPAFIIRCLLIDVLMTIFSSMNHHDVKFQLYSDVYFETLYYCRSCNWEEKKQEITTNLLKLLDVFQSEQHLIRTNQIQEYMEQNYASGDLSITTLAEHFHVSIAYMSYLFKKEFQENFVDYLWKLRFCKATDMLLHTDLPIDTISVYVGYVNPSSFRRKFKQETGMTPSQFRTNSEEETN